MAHEALGSLSFASPTYGWASVGVEYSTNTMVETTDGARTWRTISDPCTSSPVPGLRAPGRSTITDFVSSGSVVAPGHGWVLCEGPGSMGTAPEAVFETFDGGQTWKLRWAALTSYLGRLHMFPDGHGLLWLSQSSRVEETSDSGSHWHAIGTPDTTGEGTVSLWPVSESSVYALEVLPRHDLFRTDDLGQHWHLVARFPGS